MGFGRHRVAICPRARRQRGGAKTEEKDGALVGTAAWDRRCAILEAEQRAGNGSGMSSAPPWKSPLFAHGRRLRRLEFMLSAP